MSKKLADWEKQKSTYFCTVSHEEKQRQSLKEVCPDFQYWAWIDHEPDGECKTEHTHFILRNNGTRSVKQVADKLGIPSNFVQPCRKVVAYRRYFMHLDDPDKRRYSLSDVHTNDIGSFKSAMLGNETRDVTEIYADFKKLRNGIITDEEFLQTNFVELQKCNFYQKIKIFEAIMKIVQGTT